MSITHSAQRQRIGFGILRLICLGVLSIILIAGLWPFHAPRNQVYWLTNANGLRFRHHGTILSQAPVQSTALDSPASLEIWLKPGDPEDANTFLAFGSPENPLRFSLQQYKSTLFLERRMWDSHHREQTAKAGIAGVFREEKLVFLTLNSSGTSSALFIDGRLAAELPGFRFSSSDVSGQLLFGNSPVSNRSWPGELHGLAVYTDSLSPSDVLSHYHSWGAGEERSLARDGRVAALYPFDERGGNTIHNLGRTGADLLIPDRYFILHPRLLQAPWKEYRASRSYWKDVAINIGGFIPLGFCFYAYFTNAKGNFSPTLSALVYGAGTSLAIELLQWYLPTRVSGWTDFLTNTLGTYIGVIMSGSRVGRVFSQFLRSLERIAFKSADGGLARV